MKILKTISALLLSAQVLVAAQTLTYTFGDPITSSVTPYGTGPWLTIQLVELEDYTRIILSSNLSEGEFVSKIGMNLTTVDYNAIAFSPTSYQGIFTNPQFEIGEDIFNAGGGNNFDLSIIFASSQANRFNLNDSFTFDVNVPISTFSNDSMITHIQGIGSNSQSTWLVPNTIPEPNTAILGLIGALFFT